MKVGRSRKELINHVLENIGRHWYKFSRNKLSVLGLSIILIIVFSAFLAPLITLYPEHSGPYVDLIYGSKPPSKEHYFGTDVYSRDILSRIIFAFRPALFTGVVVLSIVVPIETTIGLIAGYYVGHLSDTILMRIIEIFLGLPPLILALSVSAVLTPSLFKSMVAVSIAFWPWYARLVYNMVSSLRNELYVRSAELIGESTPTYSSGEI